MQTPEHHAQMAHDSAVETPSGKGAGDENFPVGSRLIAPALREHVMAFYEFVRAADDVADNAALSPDDKLHRLDLMEDSLLAGGPLGKPRRLAESLAATGVTPRHAQDMLSAFRQDATKSRYADIAELWDYCDRSACPVGRYLVDLHGEDTACYPGADALSAVLQVLNHLQDCRKDYLLLDRVYLPLDILASAGASVDELGGDALTPGLRQTVDRLLAACEARMGEARSLVPALRDPRFAAETRVVVALADRLAQRLGRQDPLAGLVKLNKIDFGAAAAKGIWRFCAGRWR